MKSKGQILQKIKQASYRHLKRELTRLLDRKGRNCKNNRVVELPGHEIRLCALDCRACDPALAAGDRASTCGSFEPLHEKEEIKESLKKFLEERPVHELAIRFPDVAALLWTVVDDEDAQRGDLIPNALPTHSIFGVPIWVDNPEDLENVGAFLARLVKDHESANRLRAYLEREDGEQFDLFARVKEIADELKRAEDAVDPLRAELEGLRGQVAKIESDLEREVENSARLEKLAYDEKLLNTPLEARSTPWWLRWIG